jgi:hypothetical protein
MDPITKEMRVIVTLEQIDKKILAEQDDQALMLALAMAIPNSPEKGDAELLLISSSKVRRLHAKHKILLVIIHLMSNKLIYRSQFIELETLLGLYENDQRKPPDFHLKQSIESLRQMIATEGL